MKHNYKSINRKCDSDDNEEIKMQENYLGYFSKTLPTEIMTVYLDEPIKHPSYYRQVVQGIEELGEGDQLRFNISSPGGRLDGLEAVLSAVKSTPATTIAFINSDCHSAASILALNCDVVSVSPYASMLVHFVSFGYAGASNHVLKHAEHIKKTSERLFRDTYKYFLTDDEITKCVEDDYQLWLDAEQLAERLEYRQKMLEAGQEEDEPSEPCDCCCGECCSEWLDDEDEDSSEGLSKEEVNALLASVTDEEPAPKAKRKSIKNILTD